MQYCSKCRISMQGNKYACPLCGTPLREDNSINVFPVLQKEKFGSVTVMKISLFLFLSFLVILGSLSCLIGYSPWMSTAAIIGIIGLINTRLITYYYNNPIKTFHFQCYITMAATLFMKERLMIHNLLITWVYPFIFISMIIVTFILAKKEKFTLEDYVIYYVSASACSLLQLIFIGNGWNQKPAAALISISTMVIFALFVIIFHWRELKNASRKYLNL